MYVAFLFNLQIMMAHRKRTERRREMKSGEIERIGDELEGSRLRFTARLVRLPKGVTLRRKDPKLVLIDFDRGWSLDYETE